MMDITLKDFDENDTNSYDILLTGNSNVLECNSSANPAIRVGGFYSGDAYSRMCKNSLDISKIGPDSGENSEEDYDDVDDYNNVDDNATLACNSNTRYILKITDGYSDEWSKSDYDTNNQSLRYKFTNTQDKTASNIKFTKIILYDNKYKKNISCIGYWSANIGKIPYIESEQW
jgi:hypothetical protein